MGLFKLIWELLFGHKKTAEEGIRDESKNIIKNLSKEAKKKLIAGWTPNYTDTETKPSDR